MNMKHLCRAKLSVSEFKTETEHLCSFLLSKYSVGSKSELNIDIGLLHFIQ